MRDKASDRWIEKGDWSGTEIIEIYLKKSHLAMVTPHTSLSVQILSRNLNRAR